LAFAGKLRGPIFYFTGGKKIEGRGTGARKCGRHEDSKTLERPKSLRQDQDAVTLVKALRMARPGAKSTHSLDVPELRLRGDVPCVLVPMSKRPS